MTAEELQTIKARANTPPFTADNDVANSDVLELVAEVERLQAIVVAVLPALSSAILAIEGEGADAQEWRDVLARLKHPTP